jgi:potassium-dependent mechanosensitive channel
MIKLRKRIISGIVALACVTAITTCLHAQDALTGEFSARSEIGKRLAATEAEINSLPPNSDPALREALTMLQAVTQYHLAATEVIKKANDERDKAAQALASWAGFTDQKPPYSILLLDEIRETLATLETSRNVGETQLRIFTAEIEAARDKLAAHQQASRRLADDAERPESSEIGGRAARSLKIEQISSRIAAEQIARLTLRLQAQKAELDLILSKSALAERQLKTVLGKTTFTRPEFESIQQRIASERGQILAAITAAQSSATPNPLLSWKSEFLELEKTFWETRYQALQQNDAANRKTALASLEEMKTRVDDWIKIAQLRLASGSSGAVVLDAAQIQSALQKAGSMQRLIGFTIADLGGGHFGTQPLDRMTSRLLSFWNTELYLAEETEVLNGNKITTFRAVTLGKLARLALILTVGWLLLRFLSRRAKSLLSRKSKIPAATVELASKWLFGLGLALLFIYGLNTARIPFTALAFLGGALAIGVGFGTQTILKNFISGIILTFERPIKIGDQIEVDGVSGKVRNIGIRASVIDHGNGIDSIIPNSTLLENRVTNWALSNSLLRHSIKVNVEYGSSTREVMNTLRAVADEHGLVLSQPEPVARLDDFGDKALVFSLHYWFDISKTPRDALSSDLRLMIEKAFAESGLRIASADNDLRFDRETLLRIEVARSQKLPNP